MATAKDSPPVTSDPESRLDRIARDLSRTLLHGSRVQDTGGKVLPAMIATGQQIRVDLPDKDPMNFDFSVDGSSSSVPVSHDQALATQTDMTAALRADRAKYLSLNIDPNIPTWVFQQRQFTINNPPAPDERVVVAFTDSSASPPATITLTAVKLPASALQEVKRPASAQQDVPDDTCFASLFAYDATRKALTLIASANWQPAIVIRLPLTTSPPPADLPAGMQVFEVGGAPQGDRWFLDQLGLLSSILPGPIVANRPGIAGISLILEKKDNTGKPVPSPISEWSIARTNLTREARANSTRVRATDAAPAPGSLPYVAVSGGGPDQDMDAIRLLEMASITNSGGYFLRATTDQTDAQTLILTVMLIPKPDPDVDQIHSLWLPPAANAVALNAGTADAIRFNGLRHIEVTAFTPPGNLE